MQLFTNIQKELISRISQSKRSIKIVVTWFTNHDLYDAIVKKLEEPEFQLEIIVLNDRINNKREGLNFQNLIDLKADFYYSDPENMVHHKFCIIDDEILITGSYNWTYYAENRNWENVLIIDNEKVVNGYIQEFERIKQSHTRIENILKTQKEFISVSPNDYLEADYIYQAKKEQQKGNDLIAAKIYTEILKINKLNDEVVAARNEIIKKYNDEIYEVSPFEIGILYKEGYRTAIPAFEKLPFTVTKGGKTVIDNQTNVIISIQKYGIVNKTIIQLKLENIKPSQSGTEKIEHNFHLNKLGLLTITCKEINGYERIVKTEKNIKNWL